MGVARGSHDTSSSSSVRPLPRRFGGCRRGWARTVDGSIPRPRRSGSCGKRGRRRQSWRAPRSGAGGRRGRRESPGRRRGGARCVKGRRAAQGRLRLVVFMMCTGICTGFLSFTFSFGRRGGFGGEKEIGAPRCDSTSWGQVEYPAAAMALRAACSEIKIQDIHNGRQQRLAAARVLGATGGGWAFREQRYCSS